MTSAWLRERPMNNGSVRSPSVTSLTPLRMRAAIVSSPARRASGGAIGVATLAGSPASRACESSRRISRG